MLPPTLPSLYPHIRRANYMSMRDKSYTPTRPSLPPIEENGWSNESGVYIPTRCLALPAPKAVIELTKCSCKMACTKNCGCHRNNLPCTPLCKCFTTVVVWSNGKFLYSIFCARLIIVSWNILILGQIKKYIHYLGALAAILDLRL